MKSPQVLHAEAKQLRNWADRLDAIADEMHEMFSSNGSPTIKNRKRGRSQTGEYAELTQTAAILKALEHGPQTTRELFDRLNSGGQSFKKPVYITAVLGRIKDKVERKGKKIQLTNNV